MPNIKTKINAHNREILRNTPSKNTKHCNCQPKQNCLMNGACLKESLAYYATVSCNDKNYNYIKEAAKQVLRSAIVTIVINRVLELKNEAAKPTDILEDKRNIQVL